jgi:hypothetical protein
LTIKGFNLFKSPKSGKLMVGCPSKQGSDGKYYKTIYFNDDDFFYKICDLAAAEYQKLTGQARPQNNPDPAPGDFANSREAAQAAQKIFGGIVQDGQGNPIPVDPDDIPF